MFHKIWIRNWSPDDGIVHKDVKKKSKPLSNIDDIWSSHSHYPRIETSRG